MKITVTKILSTEQKTSKTSGKPYNLTSFMGSDNEFYKDAYGTYTEGEEVEMTKNDRGGWQKAATGSGGFTGGGKSYGKSPEEQLSIERQVATKAATEALRDFYTFSDSKPTDLKDYLSKIVNAAVMFERHLASGQPVQVGVQDTVQDKADAFDQAIAALGGEEVQVD